MTANSNARTRTRHYVQWLGSLLLTLAASPAFGLPLMENACSLELSSRELATVEAPNAPDLRQLVEQWSDVRVTVEWWDSRNLVQRLSVSRAADGSLRLPHIDIKHVHRGRVAISLEFFKDGREEDVDGGIVKIVPGGLLGPIIEFEQNYEHRRPAGQTRLLLNTALALFPSTRSLFYHLTLMRDPVFDGLDDDADQRPLDITRKQAFEQIVRLKATGADDTAILAQLPRALRSALPDALGPWRSKDIVISTQSPGGTMEGRYFENDDFATLSQIFEREKGTK